MQKERASMRLLPMRYFEVAEIKEQVREYWDKEPCGTRGINYPMGTMEYFEAVAERRNRWDSFVRKYVQWDKWEDRKVLEVGCGVGSELIKFVKAGADVTGIDLSPVSASLARRRCDYYKDKDNVRIVVGDAEDLPFGDGEFDYVLSWGVLHHTPNIEKAVSEIHRVLKPNGRICIMLYQKYSLVSLQMYLLFGLFALKPFRGIDDIIANHHESVGTKVYTVADARKLFEKFNKLSVDVQVTSYDLRYTRNRFFPSWISRLIPSCFGWNMIIRGVK